MARYRFLLWICLQGLLVTSGHGDSSDPKTSNIFTYQTTTPNHMTDSQIQVIPVESRHLETTVPKPQEGNKSETLLSAASSSEDKTPSASEATPTASKSNGSPAIKVEGGQSSGQQQQQGSYTGMPGFTMIANKEVAPGHVTMIGYTTPIVKVGEPIPLEQFLKQQREFQQSHAKYQQQYERLIANPITVPPASYMIRSKAKDASPSAAMEAPVKMYAPVKKNKPMAAAAEPEQAPLYQDSPPQQPYSYSYHVMEHQERPLPPQMPPQMPPQYQPQPQAQPQQQYAAPLDKPRPFLVYKPKYQKLQQVFKQQQSPISSQIPFQMISPGKSLNILPISELSNNELESPQLNSPYAQPHSPQQQQSPISSPVVSSPYGQPSPVVSPFGQPKTIEFGWDKPQSPVSQAPVSQQFQPRFQSTPSYLKSQPQQMPQPFGQPFEFPGKSVSTFVDTSSSSSSKVDPKAELQNQINFVLSNSPNLSDDTKARHRDQIIKAVAESLSTSEQSSNYNNPSSGYSTYSNIVENNKLMLMPKQSISPAHYPKMMPEKQSSYAVPKFPESINDQLSKSIPEPASYLAPPPLNYKHKMQQQIQQYLQEQIQKEAQSPSYLPGLISQQQQQHQQLPIGIGKYSKKYLPASQTYIQQHQQSQLMQPNPMQSNPMALMTQMLLSSPREEVTGTQQNPSKVRQEQPLRYTLARQTLYQAQQQQQQAQQQQPTSKSQIYQRPVTQPVQISSKRSSPTQVATTYQQLYSNYPQSTGQITQPDVSSRSTREYSEWWKESAAVASAVPPPARPMSAFYQLVQ